MVLKGNTMRNRENLFCSSTTGASQDQMKMGDKLFVIFMCTGDMQT